MGMDIGMGMANTTCTPYHTPNFPTTNSNTQTSIIHNKPDTINHTTLYKPYTICILQTCLHELKTSLASTE
ncbi:hypothetical protein EON63_24680 [archaeon]|nr:MAG: hypothetical protein EON63_24680 [archaeon]